MRFSILIPLFLLLSGVASAQAEQKEAQTLAAIADEYARLAKLCTQNRAYDAAREVLDRALKLAPDSKKLIDERAKVPNPKKPPKPNEAFVRRLPEERRKADLKGADLLADLIIACDKTGDRSRYDRYLKILREEFPAEQALKRIGIEWFAPYRRWVTTEEARRLKAGGELLNGKWLEPKEVGELDRRHATWSDPWVLSDEVHELRTTLPLRTANGLLDYVGRFRRFFLEQVSDGWDLRLPSGKLQVLFTSTQEELKECMKGEIEKLGGGGVPQGISGAAYYLQTNGYLNPCFATLEPTDVSGRAVRIPLDLALHALRHELTHQIAAEYSKHSFDRTRLVQHQFWVLEGIANFMQNYELEEEGWRLKHRRQIQVTPESYMNADFAYCRQNLGSLPRLAEFIALPRDRFVSVENYHVSGTLTYFLLHGAGGRYRKPFLKLAEKVHQTRDGAGVFEECFGPQDFSTLQREWEEFVRGLKITD